MQDDELLGRVAEFMAAAPSASMEDLATAVGLSRATLFRRYPTRHALVAAVARSASEAYVVAVGAAEPEEGSPDVALRRLIAGLTPLGARYGLVASQPLDHPLELELLTLVRRSDERIRALVHRGQEDGVFRVDLRADWVVTAMTWLVIGAADGVRLGRLAPGEVERSVAETLLGALRRPSAPP